MENEPVIRSHRDLKVWQTGMDMTVEIYALTRSFPGDERFGLTSQLRRAASSVPANIAEGNARSSTKEYLRFLSIVAGSLAEVEKFLELAKRIEYGSLEQISKLLDQLNIQRRMLNGLRHSLRKKLT